MRRQVFTLLVCCSALWVVSSHDSGCDSTLEFTPESSTSPGDGDGDGDVHRRSLSPWTWRSSTDNTRIPSTVWEAECSSRFCSGPGPGQDLDLNSVPVYQSVLVLTRRGGAGCYTATRRPLAVGCTCIRARTLKD